MFQQKLISYDIGFENVTVVLNPDNSANVTVKLNASDAEGTVTVKAGEKEVTVNVTDGKATVNLESLGVNTTVPITVVYNGDEKYNKNTTVESVDVPLLGNATVKVEIDPRPYGENTTITITVPKDADGNITVDVNGTVMGPYTPDENGTVVLNVTPDVGPNEIKVTLTNSTKYNDTETTEDIEIEPKDNYTVGIDVVPAPFGENTTVTVTVPPELKDNVTVTIDGTEYPVDFYENGTGIITVDNLTAGNHEVVVSTGGENYTDKTNSTKFDVPKAAPEMDITVEGTTPGENVTVTVTIGDNATGKAIITVDGVDHVVPVVNGTATYIIEDAVPGKHNVTAEYLGDDNYNASEVTEPEEFEVDKYDIGFENVTVVLNPDNSANVTVKLNESDAEGTLTVTVGEQNVTVDVHNGEAVVNLGSLGVNTTAEIAVVYNGDEKYNRNTTSENVDVPLLNNATIKVEVDPRPYGENTTVTITVPADANGTVTVYVNGTPVDVTPDENGTAVINVTPGVGPNEIKVTLTNSTKYNDTETTEDIEIEPKDNYTVDIDVVPAPFGENTTVTVTVPPELKDNVTVTIDGVEYPVDFDDNGTGTVTLDNLTAGNHEVVVSTGGENYTDKTNSTRFDVPKAAPELDVNVTGTTPGEDVTVTVTVGDNATGKAIITVDGVDHVVPVENGTATYVIKDAEPGKHNVTAEYLGDDNYNATGPTEPEEFEVDKYDTEIESVDVALNDDNSATVTVRLNDTDAEGNVTVKVGEQNVTVPVENGVAVVDLAPLGYDENVTLEITYSGDDRHEGNDATEDVELPLLNNATVEVEVTPGKYGENTTVTVTVPADANGTVTVYVNGTPIEVTPDENGTAVINVTPDVGPNEIKVTLTDSPKYNDTETTQDIVIEPNDDYEVEVTVTPAPFGENTTVTVTVPEDLTNDTKVTIDGVDYPVEFDENGTAVISIDDLPAGPHEIKVTTGNENYTPKENVTKFDVPKETPDMDITVDGTAPGEDVTVTVTVGDNATGDVVITVDGVDHVVPVENGTATYVIPDAEPGKHNVTAKYLGDDNYEKSDAVGPEEFEVDKYDTEIESVDVTLNDDNSATVTVRLNDTDAEGNVTVKVGEQEVTVPVENGVAVVDLAPLGYDENVTLEITYSGDDRHEGDDATEDVELPLLNNATVDVEVTPAPYGENTTVKVTVPADANGTVVLNVTPDVGPNEIRVTLTDSPKYVDTEETENVDIAPNDDYDVDVEVTPGKFGENTTVKVTVPEDLANDTKVTIDGVEYPVEFDENGTGIISIDDLPAGPHEIKVTTGNDNYAPEENVTKFDVEKAIPEETSTVDPIDVGEVATVNVTLPEDASGLVVVDVNGTKYVGEVVNGSASVSIPNLPAGTHDINITYMGDDNYEPVSEVKPVTVSKIDENVTANTSDVEAGQDVVVTVDLPEDATGTVTVKIGDVTKTVPVKGGENEILVPGVPAGEYDVEVTYNGDDKYEAQDIDAGKLNVTPKTVTDDIKVTDNGDGTVDITVPEGATGEVEVFVDDDSFKAPIVDSKAEIDLGDLAPGVHEVTVVYSGDDNHTEISYNTTIVVPRHDTPISIDVEDAFVGDTVEVTVNIPDAATGKVTVEINGKNYTADVNNGKAVFELEDLIAGNKTIIASYEGDDAYVPNATTDEFTVSKHMPSDMSVEAKDVSAGEKPVIKVTLPDDATGYVIVEVDGVGYGINLTAGDDSVTIPPLNEGNYDVVATYLGDDKYMPNSADTKLNIGKLNPEMEVAVENATRDGADVKVTLPDDATGNLTVTVDGKDYTVPAKGGENVIHVPDLGDGEHNITVAYSGDGKYANDTQNATVDIPKREAIGTVIVADSRFTRVATDYNAGERGGMFYGVLMDTDGNVLPNKTVQVAVNGPIYTVITDDEGRIGLQINLAQANVYTYALFFQGDEKYNATLIASAKLTVTKKPTSISASDVTFKASAKVKKVTVTLKTSKNPYDGKTYIKAGKWITLKADGKTYKARINSKGVAKFSLKITKKGKYAAKIKFEGDKTYEASSKTIKITVK